MPRFAVRSSGGSSIKIIETVSAEDSQVRMLEYVRADAAVTLYRVIEQPDGDMRLKKLRVQPGSEQYEQRMTTAVIEDAP